MLAGNMRQRLITLWWWASVPLTLLAIVILKIFRPTPGYMAHVLWPITVVFYFALLSSVVWTVTSALMLIARSVPRTVSNTVMFGFGIIVCALTGVDMLTH